jgi:hypothetical protein
MTELNVIGPAGGGFDRAVDLRNALAFAACVAGLAAQAPMTMA